MATSEHFYYFVENTRGVGIKIISSWVVFFSILDISEHGVSHLPLSLPPLQTTAANC